MTSYLMALGARARATYLPVGLGDAARPSQEADRTVRRIAGTFATKFLAMSVTIPLSVILARALGPAGRGELVAAAALAGLGMQFGNLGLHSANTYFVSRDRSLLGALSRNSVIAGTLFGSVIAFSFYLARAFGGAFRDLDATYFLLVMIWIPLGIGQLLQHNLIVGIQHIGVFNKIDLGGKTATLLLCAALWSAGVNRPMPYAMASVVVLALSYWFCTWYIGRQIDQPAGPALGLLRDQVPYGFKVFLGSLFAFLVVRSDVLLLNELSGSLETGLYSVAASLVDMLYLLPVAVGLVLFPELSALRDPEQRWRVTKIALLHTGWMIGAGVGVMLIWGNAIITLLFGSAFAPAYQFLIILAPAMLFYGLNSVVSTYLAAVGQPWFAVWVWVLGFGVNLSLNLIWIPKHGGVGAAWASLIAYGVIFVLQLSYVTRFRAGNAADAPAGAQS